MSDCPLCAAGHKPKLVRNVTKETLLRQAKAAVLAKRKGKKGWK